ncbi:MAG: anti-sigma factor [Deltaproteobacteria bacterium]|nr:anti-sigma factor [Deltaproteobacteria bacterium]
MTCEDARRLLDAHVDRELDVATDRELTRHLSECERCAREVESIRALKKALSEGARVRAPQALRRRIVDALGSSPVVDRARAARAVRWLPRSSAIAIPAAIAALLAFLLIPRMFRIDQGDFLVREVVAAHVRSTQVDHLTDVASSDRHTVKPWFEGKIDFTPPVTDFQARTFKLVGGRVDYLDDRPVAALVYQHGPHLINVFVWPSDGSERGPTRLTRNGYNLEHFSHAGMNYWIVSDMGVDEMEKLAALLRS